jgi:RHS repeat-associated protein
VTRRSPGQPDEIENYDYNALGAVKLNAGTALDHQRPRLDNPAVLADAAVPRTLDGAPVAMDPAGRITSIKGVTLEYDKRGRVIAVRRQSGADTLVDRFRYDERHRRYGRFKETNGASSGIEFYAYEGDDLVGVLDNGGAVRESYLFDGIDHPLRLKRAGASTYYEFDLASNVRRLRGAGGADEGGYRYSAFGLSRLNDPATPVPSLDQPLRWKGRWFEGYGLELYDVRARWWSAATAAFLGIDEFAYHDGSGSLWAWPGQNPVAFSDPTGHYAGAAGFIARRLGLGLIPLVGQGYLAWEAGSYIGEEIGNATYVRSLQPSNISFIFGPRRVFRPSATISSSECPSEDGAAGGGGGGDEPPRPPNGDSDEEDDERDAGPPDGGGERGGRGRFKRGADDLEQLEGISEARGRLRPRHRANEGERTKDSINSTEKSQQRLRNRMRRVRKPNDADEEFGDDE